MKNNYYDLSAWDEVKTDNVGFKSVRNVAVGDVISGDRIVEIKHMPYNIYRVYVE